MNERGKAIEAWVAAVPEDAYGLCPCGCGTKMRFVVKGGDPEVAKHESSFVTKWLAGQLEIKKEGP